MATKTKLSIAEIKEVVNNLKKYTNFIEDIIYNRKLLTESKNNKNKMVQVNMDHIKKVMSNDLIIKLGLSKNQKTEINNLLKKAKIWVSKG